MKVYVNTDRCVGHGLCYGVAPGVFEADDDGYPVVLSEEVPESLREQARAAALNCPENAIQIEE